MGLSPVKVNLSQSSSSPFSPVVLVEDFGKERIQGKGDNLELWSLNIFDGALLSVRQF